MGLSGGHISTFQDKADYLTFLKKKKKDSLLLVILLLRSVKAGWGRSGRSLGCFSVMP